MERLFFILRLLILLMTWVGSVLFIIVIYMQPSLTMNSNEKLLSFENGFISCNFFTTTSDFFYPTSSSENRNSFMKEFGPTSSSAEVEGESLISMLKKFRLQPLSVKCLASSVQQLERPMMSTFDSFILHIRKIGLDGQNITKY